MTESFLLGDGIHGLPLNVLHSKPHPPHHHTTLKYPQRRLNSQNQGNAELR